jgi:predicted ATP-grasp superfamily ATP-dependent carboligase
LQSLAEMAVACNTETLLSDLATLKICADKLATYQELTKHRLPVVETRLLEEGVEGWVGNVVVKIADGVGCQDSFVVTADQLPTALAELSEPGRYIIQPYQLGQAASLSCLFKSGQGWLLCCNQQHIVLDQGRFSLQGCLVNAANPKRHFYQHLVAAIAEAMPGLWGYIGIDIIETGGVGPLVLEINPRLTTSYVGIRRATGINVAEQVLQLLNLEPDLQPTINQAIPVAIT